MNDLNIETSPEDWLTPQQLAAQNPEVQLMALQAALQNPQMLAQVMGISPEEMAGAPPQGAPPQNEKQGQPGSPQPPVAG